MSVVDFASVESPFDVVRIRADFPALHQSVEGQPLVYLDNAATTHKPTAVIDAIRSFYEADCANIHRGVHTLSRRATEMYEEARRTVARFLNAPEESECLFVRGTTEAINLVAQSYVLPRIQPGDEILITALEHHSNIVPWQMLCDQAGAVLKVAPVSDAGEVDLEAMEALFSPVTRICAFNYVSNAIGTVNPVREMIAMSHARGVPVLIDGAQSAPHTVVDVAELDCDFYAFSGHKVYGPTGMGVLYGKRALLEEMTPYQGGGDMIRTVTFEKTTYNVIPAKFEAGTPNIAGAYGLKAALEYMMDVGLAKIAAHEHNLLTYATQAVADIPGLRVVGTAGDKAAVLSFVIDGIDSETIGTILDHVGVAVRTGHHCAEPLMRRFGIVGTSRASFAMYNTRAEVDVFVAGLHKVIKIAG